jgi:hypothetical protein
MTRKGEIMKIERALVVYIGVFVGVTFLLGYTSLDSYQKNDLCIEAGGVLVQTYGGYKCYSTDLRQEIVIED